MHYTRPTFVLAGWALAVMLVASGCAESGRQVETPADAEAVSRASWAVSSTPVAIDPPADSDSCISDEADLALPLPEVRQIPSGARGRSSITRSMTVRLARTDRDPAHS